MNALDELFWRDEILQALYWMRGESLAEAAGAFDLARFLAADEDVIARALAGLVEDGLVTVVAESVERSAVPPSEYRLTASGVAEGSRRFHDEFSNLTRQAHGECGPGCWCHDPEHEGEPCPSQPQPETERARA